MNEGLAVVEAHLRRLAPLQVRGAWLHGSLALGGYHHGISDQDLVVELARPLTAGERQLVQQSHDTAGPLLAASYLEGKDDPAPLTWTHGWSGRRRVSLITRAELHQAHPEDWPEVPDLAGAVAREVGLAWRRTPPTTWLSTTYVDLSLTSVVRALMTQRSGGLTRKDDAVAELERYGVPPRLARAVRDRREDREALPHNRFRRGLQTRATVRRLLAQL